MSEQDTAAAAAAPPAEPEEKKRPATEEEVKDLQESLKQLQLRANSFADFVNASLEVFEQPDPSVKGSKPLTGNPLKRSKQVRLILSHLTYRMTMVEACLLQGHVMAPPNYPVDPKDKPK